jgi:PAS domain S-box-containing protein
MDKGHWLVTPNRPPSYSVLPPDDSERAESRRVFETDRMSRDTDQPEGSNASLTRLFEAVAGVRGRRDLTRYAVKVLLVAVAYFATAKLGLRLAHEQSSITAIWAPTGIALAAILIWGYRLWPAVALGALSANAWTGIPLVSLLGITTGNTLEALAGAYLLLRVAGFQRSLERIDDVLALVFFGGVISTMVSATIGVGSLWLGGATAFGDVARDWRVWWLGDMGGDLVVAPFLLALASSRPRSALRGRTVEAAFSLALLVPLSIAVFALLPLPYLLFPAFIWSALRFRQLGATATSLVVAVIAVVFTANESGPFVHGSPDDSLLLAQGFMGVASVSALLLAAVTSQRQLAVQALQRARDSLEARVRERTAELEGSNAQLALARELAFLIAGAETVDDAFTLAIKKISMTAGCALGQAWTLNADGSCLECSPAWYAGSKGLEQFRRGSEGMTFEPGVGLPGRAWSSGRPTWITDVKSDLNFPRAALAAEAGFGAGMAVPVLDGDNVVAVIEFFFLETREPDEGVVDVVATIGAQVGSLIKRKEAEGTLQANEEQFRAVAETAKNPIVSANRNGEIIYFNSAAEEVFGYSRSETLGKPLTLLMPERMREPHRRGLERFVATGEARVIGTTVELAGRTKEGREFPLELSVSTWSSDGEPFFSAILRDITDRKRTEEKLEHALATEQEAGIRLRELDRAKDEFLATVSHELRTPLTAISGFAELMSRSPEHRDQAEWLRHIFRNASEMGVMIEQLLDYSRLEAGKVALEPGPLSVRDATLRCVDLAGEAIDGHQTSLDVPDDLEVQADERGFDRILVNLLTNAAKYSPQGSMIRVSAAVKNGNARVSVEDEGMGISHAEQAHVFERFYQGPVIPGRRGTGVGLSIVRRYVELHGGEVWVESEPDQGSTFLFTLPLAAQSRAAASANSKEPVR